jgi:hypothetical protein
MRAWTGCLFVLLGATACGCKLDSNGTGPSGDDSGGGDDGSAVEGGVPEAAPEAAPCSSGVMCNGQCIQASDCSSCSGATLLCAASGTCASDCAACSDAQQKPMPIECYACDENRANPVGTCQYDDTTQYCLSGDYTRASANGGFRCLCGDAGAGDCPGDTQVCTPSPGGVNLCLTCGEVYVGSLDGLACKNGKTCGAAAHACK